MMMLMSQAWPTPPVVRLEEAKGGPPPPPAPSTDWKMKVLTVLEQFDFTTWLLLTIIGLQLLCISHCRMR